MNRQEHLAWCKSRAIEYADDGDAAGALASFASDVAKHPDTADLQGLTILGFAHMGSGVDMRHFIEGFN
jgi:hypothetical protein